MYLESLPARRLTTRFHLQEHIGGWLLAASARILANASPQPSLTRVGAVAVFE
jgi:hypothetical protein